MLARLSVLLTLCMLAPAWVAAEGEGVESPVRGMVSGYVHDAATGKAIPLVSVFLDTLLKGTTTDARGEFALRDVPPGRYRLEARHIGYAPYVEEMVRLRPGGSLWRAIALVPTEVEAPEVVVTAARREQTAQMAPASVSVVSAAQIRERPVATFDEALDMVSGVSETRSGGSSVQSLSIRGSSNVAGGGVGNRVLLMIDGRPALTSDSGGALWSLVPTGCIERIEVVRGPFSSLYGSGAMGGVINVITRSPGSEPLTTVDVGYGLYEKPHPAIRYTQHTPRQSQVELSHSGRRGPLGYLLHLSRKASDGYSENAAYAFCSVFGKALYDLRRGRDLEVALSASVAENDYPHVWASVLQPLRVDPPYRDDRQEKQLFSADLVYRSPAGARGEYVHRLYFCRKAARSLFNEDNPSVTYGSQAYGLRTLVDADQYGSVAQLDYDLGEHHTLICGVDAQGDLVRSSPDTLMFGDHQVNNLAAFLQHEVAVTPKLTSTLGVRYDWNHLAGGGTDGACSPKWAAVYSPRPDVTLRVLAGQAFRAPSIAERFIQEELAGGILFETPRRLKPERMDLSLETGLRIRLGGSTDLDLACFRDQYRDLIYWVAACPPQEEMLCSTYRIANLNRALMQGLEAGLDWDWRRALGVSVHYTYLDAKDRSPGRADDLLAYRVRHALLVSLDARIRRVTVNLSGRYRSKIEEVFLFPEKPDAFFVAQAKAAVRVTGPLHISLAVNNLFDTQYEELSRYRMPGRKWVVGASMRL